MNENESNLSGRVSVIVPVRNAFETLPRLFEGMRAAIERYPGRVEVLVADNGSTDGTSELIRSIPGVRRVEARTRGPAAARNAGIREADGDLLLFLDADCVPESDWIVAWVQAFADDPDLMLAGGDLLEPEDDSAIGRYTREAHILNARRFAEGSPTRPGFYLTANFALRRSCLERLGTFDEKMWPTGEDADLCWRADELGLKRAFVPEARVWHRHRTTLGGFARQMYKYGFGAAAVTRKWHRKLGGRVEVDWRAYGRLLKGFAKLAVAPFRLRRSWRRWEGGLEIVRYAAFLAGRWRGSLYHGVLVL